MQVILCSSLKSCITPRRVRGSLQHKHGMLLPVTTAQQQQLAGAQFEAAATEKKLDFFCCVQYWDTLEHWAGMLSKPFCFIANPGDIPWYINQDHLHQGLDLFLFCSCIPVMLQVPEVF